MHLHKTSKLAAWVLIGLLMINGSEGAWAQTVAQPGPGGRTTSTSFDATHLDNKALPNADLVRRAVAAWGVGQRINVRTITRSSFRGTIESISDERFVIHEGWHNSTEVRYADVARIGPAKSVPRWGLIAIAAGAVAGIAILFTIEQLKHGS